jgi:1-phosphatidylinositol-4-phosphate 5-kinase
MMKTIPLREFTKMREVLKGYYQHMKAHPDSLLIRFYGLHQVQWRDSANTLQVRFLTIMDNIFKAFEVGLRFDLKGSTQGRTYLKPGQKPKDNKNVKTALKDNDFIQHVKYIQF